MVTHLKKSTHVCGIEYFVENKDDILEVKESNLNLEKVKSQHRLNLP